MSPQQARRRTGSHPVPRWYPGRGTSFVAPPAGVFYSSRLRANIAWWREARAPRGILQTLAAGVKLDFHTTPKPFKLSPLLVADHDVPFALADLEKGDRLGAYGPLLPGGEDFLCRSRVDTRPGSGKQRTVLNFRRINEYVKKTTCRYENIKDLPKIMQPGDYLLSLDCAGAFWHVPLHDSTAHFLSFHFALPEFMRDPSGELRRVPLQLGGYWVEASSTLGRYQVVERTCRALPFGFTNSPFVWTKVVKVVSRHMRRAGIACLWFLDDCLCALSSRAKALQARDFIEDMFRRSGLTKAPDKGVWEPTRTLPDHLGYEISTGSQRGSLKVPARRCREICTAAKNLLCRAANNARRVSTDLLRSFVGKAASVTAACAQARFRLRSIHDVTELWLAQSTLHRAALRDLEWWTSFTYDAPANGMPIWPAAPTRAIFTDASSTLGYGAVLQAPHEARKAFGGFWDLDERQQWHITLKELVAVRKGIVNFAEDLRGHVVRLWEDNQAVVHIIRNRTSRSPQLMGELRLLMEVLDELDIELLPRYIRSELNPADEFSRLTDRDAWRLRPSTHRMLRHKARRVLGTDLTLDAFACHQTKICTRYASRLFDRHALGFDGLALDWRQEVVWINPPWCLLGDIISKLQQEKPAAVLIVPHWPTQVWWPQLLRLGGSHFELPPPKFCVEALHGRLVEPFLHAGLALRAVVLQPGTKL